MFIAKNEILFIYSSCHLQDRQALGYAKSLPNFKVKEFDLQKNHFTALQLEQIADMLQVAPDELIDHNSKAYKTYYSNVKLTRKGAIQAMAANPKIIKTPIALFNDQAETIDAPFQIIKWDMAHAPPISNYSLNQNQSKSN